MYNIARTHTHTSAYWSHPNIYTHLQNRVCVQCAHRTAAVKWQPKPKHPGGRLVVDRAQWHVEWGAMSRVYVHECREYFVYLENAEVGDSFVCEKYVYNFRRRWAASSGGDGGAVIIIVVCRRLIWKFIKQ